MIWQQTQMAMTMERSVREKEHETALNEMRYEQHEKSDNTKHEHSDICFCFDEDSCALQYKMLVMLHVAWCSAVGRCVPVCQSARMFFAAAADSPTFICALCVEAWNTQRLQSRTLWHGLHRNCSSHDLQRSCDTLLSAPHARVITSRPRRHTSAPRLASR